MLPTRFFWGVAVLLLTALCGARAQTSSSENEKISYRVGFNKKSAIYDLTPATLVNGDEFGIKVDVWKNVAAVTSIGRKIDQNFDVITGGKVHIFNQRSSRTWKAVKILESAYGEDGFGLGIAVGETIVVVGAPYDSRRMENAGVVYIYPMSSYEPTTLFAEHMDKDCYFGSSVALVESSTQYSNGAVLVGAPGHNHEGRREIGAVFIYAKGYGDAFYKVVNMLEPSDMKDGANLGYSMSAYGGAIAVGAPGANTAYLFEMVMHVHECPHDRHDHDMPEACFQFFRRLQGPEGEGGEGEGPEGENHEGEEREREEREREERERENHHYYTEWKYEEVLAVHLDGHANGDDNMMFGAAVAVYNKTTLTMVVGAPGADASSSTHVDAGAMYILTQLNKNNLWANFQPDGHHDEHDEHDEPHHLRKLQGGEPGGEPGGEEGGEHNDHDEHDEHDRHVEPWNPAEHSVGFDRLDNFWLNEKVIYGNSASENFGHSVAADYHYVFGGADNMYERGVGRVSVYQRVSSTAADYNKPVISGPLYQKSWSMVGSLADTYGNNGDKFGAAVALYEDTVLVGSYLKGIQSASEIGTGAAYIYDQIVVEDASAAPTPTPAVKTSSSIFGVHIDSAKAVELSVGISLVLFVSAMGVYGVYKYNGGKAEAGTVFKASLDALEDAKSSSLTALAKLKFWEKSEPRVTLSSIDDSTSSVTPMNMDNSAGSFSSGNSGYAQQGRQFQPGGVQPGSGPARGQQHQSHSQPPRSDMRQPLPGQQQQLPRQQHSPGQRLPPQRSGPPGMSPQSHNPQTRFPSGPGQGQQPQRNQQPYPQSRPNPGQRLPPAPSPNRGGGSGRPHGGEL